MKVTWEMLVLWILWIGLALHTAGIFYSIPVAQWFGALCFGASIAYPLGVNAGRKKLMKELIEMEQRNKGKVHRFMHT